MAIQLRARTQPHGIARQVLGRITRAPVEETRRADYIRVIPNGSKPVESLAGYAAVLAEGTQNIASSSPVLKGFDSLAFLRDGYVGLVDTGSGQTRAVYRPDSDYNILFATDRCNSNCLMCSQPPKEVDDSHIVAQHLRLIDLIDAPPQRIGITGGEPTLLKDGLVHIIERLKERFPDTFVLMLSNGRLYAYEDFVQKLSSVRHPKFLTSIPLYADNALDHDYVVQAHGAFDQTVQGFYNATKHNLAVEVRVVLHKQTIPGLLPLAEFIYRNLPFVRHIALMGLENMGYVKKNWDLLWIDPVDYGEQLEAAVQYLFERRVSVSLYNLPLCVLPRKLWGFARMSISDFKNIYLEECDRCSVKAHCGGLFQSSKTRHSRGIRSID